MATPPANRTRNSAPDDREVVEGWAFPTPAARKAHYFVERRSLCGNYVDFGLTLDRNAAVHPDDCKTCHKNLDSRGYHR